MPDVVTVPYPESKKEQVEDAEAEPAAADMEDGELEREGARVAASPRWIREFLTDFRDVRLLLRR